MSATDRQKARERAKLDELERALAENMEEHRELYRTFARALVQWRVALFCVGASVGWTLHALFAS